MPFKYKDKVEFTDLDFGKKCYYLARLYIAMDEKKGTYKYKTRLFTCINYLKKQPEPVLSILYNYLSDNKHNGLMIWEVVPKAVLYDQNRRRERKEPVKQYEEFNKDMLDEILSE